MTLTHAELELHPEGWERAIQGFEVVRDPSVLLERLGCRVRYASKSVRQGTMTRGLTFRLGGVLVSVDPELRYFVLKNTRNKQTWCVQLRETQESFPIIHVWDTEEVKAYKRAVHRGSYDDFIAWVEPKKESLNHRERAMASNLLRAIDDGTLRMTRRPPQQ
jgi:hypothetical protein